MRNMRTGGELERLPPVENFLASHMPLQKKKKKKKKSGQPVSDPVVIEAKG